MGGGRGREGRLPPGLPEYHSESGQCYAYDHGDECDQHHYDDEHHYSLWHGVYLAEDAPSDLAEHEEHRTDGCYCYAYHQYYDLSDSHASHAYHSYQCGAFYLPTAATPNSL